MNANLQKDNEELSLLLKKVMDIGLDFLNNIGDAPTAVLPKTLLPEALPQNGIGALATLKLFEDKYKNIMVASAGARYWGFVTGGTTPAALAGDWLTAVYDQNTQGITGPGDVSAIVELETIKLLLQLFNLPTSFTGGFVSGATMSNFTCLAVARQWAGMQTGDDVARNGVSKEIVFAAAMPHSSAIKCLSMLGTGSANIYKIATLPQREAVDVVALESFLQQHNNKPIVFISSGGTVNTVDFDDMQAIALLKQQYNFWWHIDAAFGGFAACSTTHAHLLQGWQYADSITVDCHKWLNVPYDSAVFFVHEKHRQLQVQTFQNTNAPYLGDPFDKFSYLNFLPENSRRFRALPAWFTLMAYGNAGYQSIIDNNIELAAMLGKKIEQSKLFVLAAPVRLNTVCFFIKGYENNNDYLQRFVYTLNERGKVFMTPTIYNGQQCIRAAFVNWRTSKNDIGVAWSELKETAAIIK